MNLSIAKKSIESQLNVLHIFQYKGSRNQVDELSGKIIFCFSSIFLILTDNNHYKCFSYNDYIADFFRFIS